VGSGGLRVTLFPKWAPLREGYPSIRDWNDFGSALAGARGVNGVNLSLQGGALVVAGSGAVESPWWRVRPKAGDATKVQVSGGFVRMINANHASPLTGLATGATAGRADLWTDVVLYMPTLGVSLSGCIFAVHLAIDPHDELHLIADDQYGTDKSAAYPPGTWTWIKVGVYSVDAEGVVSGVGRTFFGGETIVTEVVPSGTVRMYGTGAVPAGWAILDGTGGRVNAFGCTPRMTLGALFGTLAGLIDGTVTPGTHTHPLQNLVKVYGTAGTDDLSAWAYANTPETTGPGPAMGTAGSEKALAVVYAIKL
jgi:hypothetical protein